MANQDPTPAGAEPQAGNTAHVETGSEQHGNDTPFDASAAIQSMDDIGAMESVLFGESLQTETKKPAPSPPTEPAQGTQQARTTETGSEQHGQDEDDASAPASREPNEQGPERISLRSLPPAERKLITEAVNLFRSGKATSVEDALNQLAPRGDRTPQEQQAGEDDQQDPPSAPARQPDAQTPDAEVERISSLLADLRKQRKQAVDDYDRETETRLTEEIEDALADLGEARINARQRKSAAERQDKLVTSAIEEVHLRFPESEDPDSFFSFRLSRALDAYQSKYGSIAENPTQLMVLAQQVEDSIRSTPGTRQQQVHQAPKPQDAPRPLGMAARGQNTPPPISREILNQKIQEASADELFEALTGIRP